MTERLTTEHMTAVERRLSDLTDRWEIEDALSRYSIGIDHRDWGSWEKLFTADALLDYSAIGVGIVSPEEFRDLVSKNDSVRIAGQHLHSNVVISLDGDSSTARAEYTMYNVVRLDDDPGFGRMTRAGGWVLYELSHTRDLWQIRRRITHTKWSESVRIPISA